MEGIDDEETGSAAHGARTPEEFMSRARRQALAGLKRKERDDDKQQEPTDGSGDTNVDIMHLLRITRALVATNKEIWERCKEQRYETRTGEPAVFKRVEFKTVRAKKKKKGHQVYISLACLSFLLRPNFRTPLLHPRSSLTCWQFRR
jgi:hypothetical protein